MCRGGICADEEDVAREVICRAGEDTHHSKAKSVFWREG